MKHSPSSVPESASLDRNDGRIQFWAAGLAVVALLSVLAVDYYFLIADPRLLVVGVLDELAHAATAIVLILCLWRCLNRWFVFGCMAGAVLLDIDHLPMMRDGVTAMMDAGRPMSHSLFTIVILAVPALLLNGRARFAFIGAALGVATHLFRDLATGGVPLFWPLTDETVEVAYLVYAGVVAVLATVPILRLAMLPQRQRNSEFSVVHSRTVDS